MIRMGITKKKCMQSSGRNMRKWCQKDPKNRCLSAAVFDTEGLKRSPACSFSRLKNELLRRRDRADQQKSQNLAL